MKENTFTATELSSPQSIDEIFRIGAQEMIRFYLHAEIQEFIDRHEHLETADGLPAVVRNGYNRERNFTTTAGTIKVQVPRTRDRSGSGISFSSALVPRYMRRSLSIEEAIPCLEYRPMIWLKVFRPYWIHR